jgi:capsular polysaccharide biosynthesis protein
VHHATAVYSAAPIRADGLRVDEQIRLAQHLAQTYKFAFGTPAVLDALTDRLGVDASGYPGYPKISISVPAEIFLMTVVVTHPNRDAALALANGFSEAVTGGSDLGSLDLQGARGSMSLFAPAQIVPPSAAPVPASHVPLAPRQGGVNRSLIVVSAIGGLIVGALAAVGLEAIGGKARWLDQVAAATGLRAVGRLRKSSRSSKATALIGRGDEAVI